MTTGWMPVTAASEAQKCRKIGIMGFDNGRLYAEGCV